jgi:AAA15 family ATPase/GTPase
MIYSGAKDGSVFIVDELDRKLHSLLAFQLVDLFLCQSRGQIIFTTHTTHLLDLELLRRDEIWLVQKKPNGSSDLYSLNDFKIRPDLDVRKGYLEGRFGGVPFVGDVKALGWC